MALLRKILAWTGVLPAIETTGMTNKDIPELIARCHSAMAKAIAELGESKAQ
ncbi:hypothetical protein [Marinobacter gelidimuriae]|uniref:hypothetical protein n=1 Tax=Marinobacter gelidimuriae TaxID=2739064 RepID=UPI00036B240C|nr:hypothetical protein [Marinobacter gelidimuriae]